MRATRPFFFWLLLAALMLVLPTACDRGSSNQQTKDQRTEETGPAPQAEPTPADTATNNGFLLEAYSYGLMIVHYSELAVQKSERKAVTSFAEQSASWHKDLNRELHQMAEQKKVSLPREAGQDVAEYTKELRELPANRFDERYLQVLRDIQRQMISEWEKASADTQQPELQHLAKQKLPDLHAHAQAVQDLHSLVQK